MPQVVKPHMGQLCLFQKRVMSVGDAMFYYINKNIKRDRINKEPAMPISMDSDIWNPSAVIIINATSPIRTQIKKIYFNQRFPAFCSDTFLQNNNFNFNVIGSKYNKNR